MTRRDLLKALLVSPIAATLDVEKLLWVPGEKTIFLPEPPPIYMSQVIAVEMERIFPKIQRLFESDDLFYRTYHQTLDVEALKGYAIRIPLNSK